MIELKHEELVFSFPEVHPDAKLTIEFHRTLRIPDDGQAYRLPPGLGLFPLRHVDDFAGKVPQPWLDHGGVMLPMYQSEALWISFSGNYVSDRSVYPFATEHSFSVEYPFAIKIAAGKINAITGETWSNGLRDSPQDYVVVPGQPWLDGFCVEKGYIRQFIAMPLGALYTAEEQVTGKADNGGLQIVVYPMKREVFEARFPRKTGARQAWATSNICSDHFQSMGLAPGGKMHQEIYEDPFDFADWDIHHKSRCFVHIANSMVWRLITGENPPTVPPTSKEYTDAGLPWFEYFSENGKPLYGSEKLGELKSVATLSKEKGQVVLPENTSVTPENIHIIREKMPKEQVREGTF